MTFKPYLHTLEDDEEKSSEGIDKKWKMAWKQSKGRKWIDVINASKSVD